MTDLIASLLACLQQQQQRQQQQQQQQLGPEQFDGLTYPDISALIKSLKGLRYPYITRQYVQTDLSRYGGEKDHLELAMELLHQWCLFSRAPATNLADEEREIIAASQTLPPSCHRPKVQPSDDMFRFECGELATGHPPGSPQHFDLSKAAVTMFLALLQLGYWPPATDLSPLAGGRVVYEDGFKIRLPGRSKPIMHHSLRSLFPEKQGERRVRRSWQGATGASTKEKVRQRPHSVLNMCRFTG